MALRTSKIRSITPSTFVTHSSISAIGAAAISPRTLAIPLIPQQRSNWCWAACADMVKHYYGNSSLRQCDFVNEFEDESICCNLTADPKKCNLGITSGGVGPNYFKFGITARVQPGPILASALQAEIAAGRPVQVMFKLTNNTFHGVLVRGWVQGPSEPLYLVNDPGPVNVGTSRTLTYQGLLKPPASTSHGLGGASWLKTWTGIA